MDTILTLDCKGQAETFEREWDLREVLRGRPFQSAEIVGLSLSQESQRPGATEFVKEGNVQVLVNGQHLLAKPLSELGRELFELENPLHALPFERIGMRVESHVGMGTVKGVVSGVNVSLHIRPVEPS